MNVPNWVLLATTAREWGLTPWELHQHPYRELMIAVTLQRSS